VYGGLAIISKARYVSLSLDETSLFLFTRNDCLPRYGCFVLLPGSMMNPVSLSLRDIRPKESLPGELHDYELVFIGAAGMLLTFVSNKMRSCLSAIMRMLTVAAFRNCLMRCLFCCGCAMLPCVRYGKY
jgi:hypothetical protein